MILLIQKGDFMIEFTKRQAEILDCLILGLGIIDTAERLGLNKNTIEYHLKKAKRENGMNTVQLVAEYVKRKVRAKYECVDKSEFRVLQ